MKASQDLSGKKFGRWLAIRPAPKKNHQAAWECQCECGTVRTVRAAFLRYGSSASCGCLQRELAKKKQIKHGFTRHKCRAPEYNSYWNAYLRCSALPEFIAHIGRKPSPEYSLDRIDNNGHYEIGNVRWATASEQQQNSRNCL